MDLSTLSMAELQVLRDRIPAEIAKRAADNLTQAQAAICRIVDESGLSRRAVLGPLLSKSKSKAISKAINLKLYRNPANPIQAWTGIGKRPNWLVALLATGVELESLRVS